MSYRKFNSNDILVNTMVTHPSVTFYIYNGDVFYNNIPDAPATRNTASATPAPTAGFPQKQRNVDPGYISLYEYNIDRPYLLTDRIVGTFDGGNLSYDERVIDYDGDSKPIDFVEDRSIIYPFIAKTSTTTAPKTITDTSYATAFKYGDVMTAFYPLSASISREFITGDHGAAYRPVSSSVYGIQKTWLSIRNRLDHYQYRSIHYKTSSSFGTKANQSLNIIHVPSIFYGTRIQPGTMSLKYFVTGTLAGELVDTKQNGELIQVSSSLDGGALEGAANNGKVAGVVLYDEGIIILTGSWKLSGDTIDYGPNGGDTVSRWIYFASGAELLDEDVVGPHIHTGRSDTDDTFNRATFRIDFKGHTETQTINMFAHARPGEANISNNPTYITKGQDRSSYNTNHIFQQSENVTMKNIVSSSYADFNAPFKRQVFISRVGIYDKDKNLIAISSLANPILKEDKDSYTFKIKFDV